MIGQLTNHVWQSTLFAIAAALLTFVFRKNRAAVRYGLWFTASLKFCIPLSLLMGLGSYIRWTPVAKRAAASAISFTMVQFTQPFPNTLPALPSTAATSANFVPVAILGVWVCGFIAIALMRFHGWRRIRAALRSSIPIDIPSVVEVRSSPGLLEPGVVGLFDPVLLVPDGIAERLTPPQLVAVLGHELCHVRRRDNLTSAIHMIVEAVFWFHPLVWWIGARLVEERERACDEAVLSLGNAPSDYAEGILSVCKSYLESPLACVSGVTGSNLKKRIQAILTGDAPGSLNLVRKFALAIAGIAALAVPVVVGVISAAHIQAQLATPKFETASITPCQAFQRRSLQNLSPGTFHSGCTTVQRFIQQAYGLFADGHENPLFTVTVTGGPTWADSDFYQIDAKAAGNETQAMMNGPMLRALLVDRFKLKIHSESREVPVYSLTVAKGGPNLQPFQGTCIPWDSDNPPAEREPEQMCGRGNLTSGGVEIRAATMTDLCMFFLVTLDRPVIDKTGIAGRFNFHLEVPTGALGHGPRGLQALSDPTASAPAIDPSFISATKTEVKKLGLDLEPASGPGEFLVIDSLERPSEK
jgi:bla regulator protein BlaR1